MKFRFVNKLFILKQFKCVQTWSKLKFQAVSSLFANLIR